MAHSAAAAARTRFASSRASSPYDDNAFATATGTSFKDIIHSTPQRDYNATEEDLPLHYDQYPEPSEDGSQGSADMSIEIGRGVKRGAQHDNDVSSNFFNINDNSQNEIMGTPPARPRNAQRKSDGTLRKEASVRRATESVRLNDASKRNMAAAKQRAVSDNSPRVEAERKQQASGTFNVRSSRFANSQRVSSGYTNIPTRFTANAGLQSTEETPRMTAAGPAGNVTVHSATYAASHSFMFPDITGISDLVSGTPRRDPQPAPKRNAVSRSRFASGSYKPSTQDYAALSGIPVPEDERAIFASLHLIKEKCAHLETEKSENEKRIHEFELEVSELRSQLHVANRRPDSALGSEDDTMDAAGSRSDKARLQAKLKALQDRLSSSERKISIAEITSNRVMKERDHLVTQIATMHISSEELENENQELRGIQTQLEGENQELRDSIEELKKENVKLQERTLRNNVDQIRGGKGPAEKATAASEEKSQDRRIANDFQDLRLDNGPENEVRSRKRAHSRSRSTEHHESTFVRDIASRIEKEVLRFKREGAAKTDSQPVNAHTQRSASARSRSRSRARNDQTREERAALKRHVSAPAEIDVSETESTTELDVTRKSQKSAHAFQEDQDLTVLSDLDQDEVANLRRKLEEERRSGRRHKRASSATEIEAENTSRSLSRHSMPRKSSLKDLTGGLEGTGRFSIHGDDAVKATKTVRVQSPHSSQDILELEQDDEAGNISMLSNTSRRRRRASSIEGMTSAFIVPDITIHGSQTLTNLGKSCIHHNAASCTICAQGRDVTITKPVPVTERDVGDITDATIRPAQDPADALAVVIKNLEDEVKHLKMRREAQNRLYNQHDPALSKRRRQDIRARIDGLTDEIERRSEQVYRLHDVLLGQQLQAEKARARGEYPKEMDQQEVDETLESVGIDPAELSGRVGRKAPVGLDDGDELSEESEFMGLSDVESEEEVRGFGRVR